LQIDSRLNEIDISTAAQLRPLVTQTLSTSTVVIEPPARSQSALTKAIAAILLTTHPAALIHTVATDAASAGDENWYRQLIALHHSNATLRYATATMLDFDAQNALVWVDRSTAAGATPPVVVVCNLSNSPVQLSMRSALAAQNLRGTFLHTLLRSDSAMGSQNLDSVSVPPFGVYIGELRR